MRNILLTTALAILASGCVSYPCTKTYTLVWADYVPRSISGLSLKDCYEVGANLPTGIEYRCLEERTRGRNNIHTYTRIHVNVRGGAR